MSGIKSEATFYSRGIITFMKTNVYSFSSSYRIEKTCLMYSF